MTIQADLTPTQCRLVRLCLQFEDGVLVRSDAEIDIFNADNSLLLRHSVAIPWGAVEQDAIETNVATKYAAFKLANSFTEYAGEGAS